MPTAVDTQNHIQLRGRLSGDPEERTLPSGDAVVSFRLVVNRARPREGGPTIDTFDCVAWTAALRRRVLKLEPGDELAVVGALRRRFWKSAAGSVSKCEVEVAELRRLSS
ncbi:MAG TPA: single-stranded DNA-binding protein [Mycobacteriales bacterium]|nr:single-stranded DNA-binding protein [Mycobacteriales bacterium]